MKFPSHRFAILAILTASVHTATAARLYKDAAGTDLNATTSWATTSGGATPPASLGTADALRFNEVFAPTGGTSFTASLSANLTVGGIELDSGTGSGGAATGDIVIPAGHTLTLNGASLADINYANAGIVLNSASGGTLTIHADIIVGATQQWVTSRGLTISGGVDLGAGAARTLNVNTATTTAPLISGVISGATGNFTKSGNGTLYLNNAANSFGGTVIVSGGTLKVDKIAIGGSVSSLGSGTSAITLNGGTLNYVGTTTDTTDRAITMVAGAAINNNGTGGTLAFTATTITQTGAASARTLTLGGSNATANTFALALGDSGTGTNISRLQKSGPGRWHLTNAHTYTGATIINQGTLVAGGGAVLGGAAGSTADEGNLWFTSVQTGGALHFETVANLGPADQIRFRNTGGTAGSGGALVYIGTTAQTLSKTIQCDSSIGIRLESNSVGGKLTYNGAFIQTNRTLYLGGTGTGDNTLATPFTGTGGMVKRDAGTWILTGSNSYTGTTTVNGGTLVLGASDTLANTSAVAIGAATLATAAGISDTLGTLDPTATATLHLGSGATLAFANSSAVDWTNGTLVLTGSFVSGSSLKFGSDANGLTSDQLARITASGLTGFALDSGGFLTATTAPGYSAWAATNLTTGTIGQDHDGDGVPNGVEFFLHGNTDTTGFTTLPELTSSGGTFSVSFTKAADYSGSYNAQFFIETSPTLAEDSWTTAATSATPGVPGTVYLNGSLVTYTFPAGTRHFARLKVTGP